MKFKLQPRTYLKMIFIFTLLITVPNSARDSLKSALLLNEGIELSKSGNLKDGISKMTESLKEDDTNAAAYSWRGVTYFQNKEYEKALKDYLKANELDPGRESHLGWIASIYDALGDKENAKKYREQSANPPKVPPVKLLPLEKIEGDYLKSGLSYFNEFQKSIGGKSTRLDPALNNAAKKHAEYLYQNHFGEMITTQWHNEEKGKPGYIGKAPEDQAKVFGFKSSPGYFTGNTMGGFNNYDLFSTPEYLFRHLANTLYHRGLVVAPNFESIGLYRWKKGETSMLVYFMSYEISPEKDKLMHYPGSGQTDIPPMMFPEIPHPVPEDDSLGFPVTVQLFSKDYENYLSIAEANIKNENEEEIPSYLLDPSSPDQVGSMMKTFKMAGLIPKDPLDTNKKYTVYMKLADRKKQIVFEKEWSFTTAKDMNFF